MHLVTVRARRREQRAVFGFVALCRLSAQKLVRRLANHVTCLQAHQLAVSAVQTHISPGHVFQHHRYRKCLKQCVNQGQAFFQRLGAQQSFGAIAGHTFIAQKPAVLAKARPTVNFYPAVLTRLGFASKAHAFERQAFVHVAMQRRPTARRCVQPVHIVLCGGGVRAIALQNAHETSVGQGIELMIGSGLPKPVARHFGARSPQLCCQTFFCDVDVRARQPLGTAVGAVSRNARPSLQPQPVPFAVQQSGFELVKLRFALQVQAQGAVDFFQVVRMNPLDPRRHLRGQGLLAIAQQISPTGAQAHLARLQIPLAGGGIGAF